MESVTDIVWDKRETAVVVNCMVQEITAHLGRATKDWERAFKIAKLRLPENRRKDTPWKSEFGELRDLVEEKVELHDVSVEAATVSAQDEIEANGLPEVIVKTQEPVPVKVEKVIEQPIVPAAIPAPLLLPEIQGLTKEQLDTSLNNFLLRIQNELRTGDAKFSQLESLIMERLTRIEAALERLISIQGAKTTAAPSSKKVKIAICNLAQSQEANLLAKLKHLPIVVDFYRQDQHRSLPKTKCHDLMLLTQVGGHSTFNKMVKVYGKASTEFVSGGFTSIVERIETHLSLNNISFTKE